MIPMDKENAGRDLLILDAAPPPRELDSPAVADLDGDGRTEIVTGGKGALLWYRPATYERGPIATGHFHVGLALADLDGDGELDLIVGEHDPFTPYRARNPLLA